MRLIDAGYGDEIIGDDILMPNASYFRQQAERCLRLARMCADTTVAKRLNTMAAEFIEQAEGYGPDNAMAGRSLPLGGAAGGENTG